jgi:glyoxylase I family protein
MRPTCIHHLAVKVADLPAAERFYASLLGLPVLRRWPAADGQGERSLWLDLGGGAFLALERAASAAALKRDAWAAHLAAAGHPVYQQTDYTLYARDPEGNRVGLSHWPDRA